MKNPISEVTKARKKQKKRLEEIKKRLKKDKITVEILSVFKENPNKEVYTSLSEKEQEKIILDLFSETEMQANRIKSLEVQLFEKESIISELVKQLETIKRLAERVTVQQTKIA